MLDEQLIWEGRPEWLAYWLPLLMACLFVLPIIGSGNLPAIILPLGIVAFIYLLRLQYYFKVTNKRIICRRGIISKKTSEIEIVDIRSVNVNQGLIQRFINIGNLEFSTASGPSKEAVILGIKNPEQIKERIRTFKTSKETN